MTGPLHWVVPGPLRQRTGGYRYDARMVDELTRRGRRVTVHEVPGRFPEPDDEARAGLLRALDAVPAGGTAVVDGLALGGLPEVAAPHASRLALVALVHHPLADETGLPDALRRRFAASEREALGHAHRVIATSTFTARRLGDYGVARERIRVVEPGTDPAPPARGPGATSPPRLLCIGTVTPRKGHDLLVEALAGLTDRRWECVCAGSLDRDPEFARRVREAATGAGLGRRLVFAGEVSDPVLERALDSASVVVSASWFEGYGMALAEALARGLPVVATAGGAAADTVPADAGLLVAPGDAEALRRALATLLDEPDRRRALAEAARAHAHRLPDWPAQAARLEVALDGVLPAAGSGIARGAEDARG